MATPPPLDLSTARANTKFASFYNRLTAGILNPDGSAKVPDAFANSRLAVTKDLRTAQHTAAKTAILRDTLAQLNSDELPDELLDLIDLIAQPPSPEDEARLGRFLKREEIDTELLGRLVSRELVQVYEQVMRVADPLSHKPCTVDKISAKKAALVKSRARLHAERLNLANAASQVQETQRDIFTATIQALESVKYGSVARADAAEAAYLSMAAEGLDEKLKVMKLETLQSMYGPEVKRAIEAYGNHLVQSRAQLRSRERSAKESLDQYDDVGRSMGQIAERYVGLVQEIEDVKEQIRRLESE